MSDLQALLFDVDGTLADTERDGHRVAFNAAFAEAGLDWHWSEPLYGELLAVTGGKERIRHYLDRFRPEYVLPDDASDFIAGLHAAKTRHYTELLARGEIPLRPGVQTLIQSARDAGLRLAIATTTTPENVTALLTHTLGAASIDWFEVIAAGDIVPAKKPAPDIYTYAMAQLGLAPDQCMAFEDSHNGVRSVLDAGIRCLLVTTNGYTADDDLTGASAVLDQLGTPGHPCRASQGPAPAHGIVDLDYLRDLHRQALERAA
jgi:HAD superfamily hydrolase (TIGR01509 family)